jgi:hypothetical protein
MPLNPQFVQRVSEITAPGQKVPGVDMTKKLFTNVSSQMADPGMLPRFFHQQNTGYPMPFTDADIPQADAPLQQQLSEMNNVSVLPRVETLTRDFDEALQSNQVRFRTGSMRAWGVPLGMTELRATDASY